MFWPLPLPPKMRFHQAATAAKLAATAATLPPPRCCYLRRHHCRAAAAATFVSIVIAVAVIVAVFVVVAVAAFCWLLIVCAPAIAVDGGVFISTTAERGDRTAVVATVAAMPAGVALSMPCSPPPALPASCCCRHRHRHRTSHRGASTNDTALPAAGVFIATAAVHGGSTAMAAADTVMAR
jgi:hypothetical protein